MVGSDPDRFEDLGARSELAGGSAGGPARGDYSNASWSWEKALKPYLARAPPTRNARNIRSSTARRKGSLDIFEQAFRVTGIMERVCRAALRPLRPGASRSPSRRNPAALPARNWSFPEHKVILCYEIAEEFVQLYKTAWPRSARDPQSVGRQSVGRPNGLPVSVRPFTLASTQPCRSAAFRKRLPVAAKIALVSAGAMGRSFRPRPFRPAARNSGRCGPSIRRRFIHAQHLIGVEIGLLDTPVFQRDRAIGAPP